MSILHTYSDDVRDNATVSCRPRSTSVIVSNCRLLGYCNAAFYDAIQTDQDGYDCVFFAGTDALVHREALDLIAAFSMAR